MAKASSLSHPNGLYLLFFTEMWERFSYYGMRALLIIYCISTVSKGGMGWSAADAGQLYGFYTGLVYITTLAGGYLADRFLGQQKSILIGGIVITLGHACLAFDNYYSFFAGLIILILGTGFFKPNISSLVGQLYPDGSPLIDAAYTIFYMGINIGSFFGILICGYLGEKVGWHYGFGAAGIGMAFGMVVFHYKRKILGNVGILPIQKTQNEIIVPKIVFTRLEWDKIMVILILSFFSIVFWMSFEQAGSSMSIFALNYTDRYILFLDYEIPSSWFQSLNPLFIMIFAPLISILWVDLAKRGRNISNPYKFSLALLLAGLGFVILGLGSIGISQGEASAGVSFWFLVFCYLFQTIGELCLSPIGLSSVNKLAPPRIFSLMFGIWFLATGLGNYISGALGGLINKISSEHSLSYFFITTAIVTVGAAAIMFIISKPLKKMMHGVE